MSFLSRSTQESGLSQNDKLDEKEEMNEYKSRKVKAIVNACEQRRDQTDRRGKIWVQFLFQVSFSTF